MLNFDNLSKFGIKVVRFFFVIFAIIFAVGNLFTTVRVDNLISNQANYEFGFSIKVIILFCTLLGILIVLIKNNYFGLSDKLLLVTFLIIAFGVSVYWLITNNYHLVNLDDAYNVFEASKLVVNHDYSSVGYKTYINTYPNNIGLLSYEFVLIKLFGEIISLYIFRCFNIIFMILGYYYLFRITDILFKNIIVNCTVAYLMFFSGQFIFYTFFAYGNCLSYSLATISVFYLIKYIKQENKTNLILSCFCIIVSITIKMNSIIILIAELLYLLLNYIKTKKIFVVVIAFFCIIGTYCGTTGLQKFWSSKGQINYDDSKLPLICWVAYGLNYDDSNPGHYFPEFEQFHWDNDFVPKYTSMEARRYIKEALTFFTDKPSNGVQYFFKKFIVSWANPQFEAFDQYRYSELTDLNKDIIGGNINIFLEDIWDATLSLISIGILLFIFINKHERNIIDYIGCVVVIGGFLFHTVWEVKAIYLYQYYMFLLPYAAYGLASLQKIFRKSNCVR